MPSNISYWEGVESVSVLQIVKVVNPYNGVSVDIEFDRPPADLVQVFVSRVPEECGIETIIHDLGSKRYRVISPFPVAASNPPELAYLTAEDAEGYSTYRNDDGRLVGQAAAWIGHTREDELTDVMKRLWGRIVDNKVGIEARLQAIQPDTTIKQIVWGMGEKLETYPAMEINQVGLSEPYAGAHRYRIATVRADIYGYIVHQNPTVESELITAFGRAVQKILNQEAYEQMELQGGQTLAMCQAQDLQFDANIWDGRRWVSSFSLAWTGDCGEVIA